MVDSLNPHVKTQSVDKQENNFVPLREDFNYFDTPLSFEFNIKNLPAYL